MATQCRVLGVSPSGYYAWRKRPPAARASADAALTEAIRAIHARSRGTHGAPRIHAELAAQGVHVGRKRVARLLQAAGLAGVSRRRHVWATRRDPAARPAPDLVQRAFAVDGPNRLWVADITYIPTWAGFLYLAVVLVATPHDGGVVWEGDLGGQRRGPAGRRCGRQADRRCGAIWSGGSG
jgi:putative transposase